MTRVPNRDARVIGFFAYLSPEQVVCTDVDACVIAGSDEAMRSHLAQTHPVGARHVTVRKTRFGEILRGLELGAAYAFDEESYERFYPLAREAGLPVETADFEKHRGSGERFFTVRLVTR